MQCIYDVLTPSGVYIPANASHLLEPSPITRVAHHICSVQRCGVLLHTSAQEDAGLDCQQHA